MKLYTLQTSAPAVYYLLRNFEVRMIVPSQMDDKEASFLHAQGARLLTRRIRRLAFRGLKRPWPIGGGAPERFTRRTADPSKGA